MSYCRTLIWQKFVSAIFLKTKWSACHIPPLMPNARSTERSLSTYRANVNIYFILGNQISSTRMCLFTQTLHWNWTFQKMSGEGHPCKNGYMEDNIPRVEVTKLISSVPLFPNFLELSNTGYLWNVTFIFNRYRRNKLGWHLSNIDVI